MSDTTAQDSIQEKLAQFNEFFAIGGNFSVNIKPLEKQSLTSFEQFFDNMPMPFKMASDVAIIDQSALRSINGLSTVAGQLVDLLNYQSQKIDLLIRYILSQHDDEKLRYQGISFGGGGIVFTSDSPFEVGVMLEMKIFILHANCAVYCLGEVIAIEQSVGQFQQKAIFHYIREEDREIMVRASLHEQSKQLQALAKARNSQAASQP